MMRRALLTGLGLGYAPVASGTFGSLGAVALAAAIWGLASVTGIGPLGLDLAWIVLTLLATWGCVRWGPWAIEQFAAAGGKKGDPGRVVLDEWAGQWIALLALPMATGGQMVYVLAVQFFLFRLFDVVKPPPARQLERLPGGWGIVMDDLAAGVYANLVGQVLFRLVLF